MKQLCLGIALLASVFSIGLRAQVLDSRADVPFDFWLGQKLMPAGEYSIYHMSSGAVYIKGGEPELTGSVFLAQPITRLETQREGKLEFTRYGDTYFLTKIWNPSEARGYGVPKSSREKEIASDSSQFKTIGIALLRK